MTDVPEEINDRDYYVIPDPIAGDTLYIHKEKSAPAFFRGCFDYCYSQELATIYKDTFGRWTVISLLTEDIANAFLDWSCENFDLLHEPLLASESYWSDLVEQQEDKDFRLITLRGELDLYCLLKYLHTCYLDQAPLWDDVYKKIELQFSPIFV